MLGALPKKLLRVNFSDHPGQAMVRDSQARTRTVAAGTRWGKTKLAVVEIIREHGRRKAAGMTEGRYPPFRAWCVAPTYSLSMETWLEFFNLVPEELINSSNRETHQVELIDGSLIEWKSSDAPEKLRGAGLDFLVLDEAAIAPAIVWSKLRTRVIDRKGRILLISTPKGQNWFYDQWAKGQERQHVFDGTHESWQFESRMNPYLATEEVDAAAEDLTEEMRQQELAAQFVQDTGQVFRNILACATGTFQPPAGSTYVMGLDLGKAIDFTVALVMDAKRRMVVAADRWSRISWPLQVERIKNLATTYSASLVMDTTGVGDPIRDELRDQGLRIRGVTFSRGNKEGFVDNLAIMLERGDISFPPIPELIDELRCFGVEKSSRGTAIYGAPEGKHDDYVTALMLAASAVGRGVAGTMPYYFSQERRIA